MRYEICILYNNPYCFSVITTPTKPITKQMQKRTMSEYKSFNFLVYINIAVYNNIVINITGKNQNADKNSPKLLNVRIFVIEITKLPIVVFSPAKIPKLIKGRIKWKKL